MAKVTKTVAATSGVSAPSQKEQSSQHVATAASVPAPTPLAKGIIDISKLTPEQLASLQKQLKATKKAANSNNEERFKLMETMLREKDDEDGFIHTTRDILNALIAEKLVVATTTHDQQEEIKKIQARKQFLSKKRDEKGELVYPENTFGYKPSGLFGFKMNYEKMIEWLTIPENLATLTDEQKDNLTNAIGA